MPLVLHFLNVGHGDCTFIELPSGRLMMIDINNSKSLPWDDEVEDFDSSPYDYADRLTYGLLRDGETFTDGNIVPGGHRVIKNVRGDQGQFWTDDVIRVLSPTDDLVRDCNSSGSYNDCSYVIKISYGGRSVILPGDAEEPAWKSMLDALSEDTLACDILKAAHHGRKSGYYQPAVEAMDSAWPSTRWSCSCRRARSTGFGESKCLNVSESLQAQLRPAVTPVGEVSHEQREAAPAGADRRRRCLAR